MLLSEPELIAKLDREKYLFGELLALSERQLLLLGQVEVANDKAVETFQAFIDERKKLMDLIDIIQAEIKEDGADSRRREMMNGHRQEIAGIINSLQNNDQQVMQLAQKILGVFGEKLQEARLNKKASKAYYGEVDTGGKGWFIDRKK